MTIHLFHKQLQFRCLQLKTVLIFPALIAFLSLSLSSSLFANTSVPPADPTIPILNEKQAKEIPKESMQGEDIPLLGEETEQQLDVLQDKGSELLMSAANWIDSFFDDPRYRKEENRTMATLKLKFGYTKYYDFEFNPSINIKIKLPGLENKANIFITANDDTDFDTDSTPIPDTPGDDSNEDGQLSAGIKYLLSKGKHYNISTHFGVSFEYVYGGLRYRHLHKFIFDEWQARLTNRLRYYSDDGWENKLSYDVESHLSDRYFLRTTFTGVAAERYDGIPFSEVMQMYRVISIDKAILYEGGVYLDTKPDFDITDIQFKIRYRQRFFRDWLVLEVGPQLTFPAEEDYHINPGIYISFEAEFGYLEDRKAYQSIFSF